MCGGVRGIAGLRVLVGCGGHLGTANTCLLLIICIVFILLFNMILLLFLLSFSGAASPRGMRGTPGNRKHMPASHYLHCFHIIIQYDITIIITIISTIIFRGCESSWDTGGTWEPQTHANYFSLNLDNDKNNNKTKQILLSQSQCWTPAI